MRRLEDQDIPACTLFFIAARFLLKSDSLGLSEVRGYVYKKASYKIALN